MTDGLVTDKVYHSYTFTWIKVAYLSRGSKHLFMPFNRLFKHNAYCEFSLIDVPRACDSAFTYSWYSHRMPRSIRDRKSSITKSISAVDKKDIGFIKQKKQAVQNKKHWIYNYQLILDNKFTFTIDRRGT